MNFFSGSMIQKVRRASLAKPETHEADGGKQLTPKELAQVQGILALNSVIVILIEIFKMLNEQMHLMRPKEKKVCSM